MITYQELCRLKEEIHQKHERSEHTKEADIVVLMNQAYEEVYGRVKDSMKEIMKVSMQQSTFRHATNACDAFWTKKGVSVFITDYFINADFSIFGPDPIGDLLARMYREDENAIVAIASPYFNDYSLHSRDYRTQRYLDYWSKEYYGRYWTRPGVGSPSDVSYKLAFNGYPCFGVDEKGLDGLKQYIESEINKKLVVTIKTT